MKSSSKDKNPSRLRWRLALPLYFSLGLLFLSGLILGIRQWEGGMRWKTVLLQLHGYAVPLFLVSFGALFPRHILISWKARRNRVSGSIIVAACFLLIVTGMLLYYLGSDFCRAWAKFLHFWIGLLLLPILVCHIVAGIKTRKQIHHAHKKHK